MGRRKSSNNNNINGIVLLDKRVGISSNGALQEVKRLLGAGKAGHTGSLDPLASGLLPICMGEATKISSFLLDTDKQYRVSIRLGVKTTTGDVEGDVVEKNSLESLCVDDIKLVLSRFVGKVSQVPPMYSALKQDGVRLYELARKGITVKRQPRDIFIRKLEYRHYRDGLLDLDVCCSKGTYIRTLAEDIGDALGCGAHVDTLYRTRVGAFDVSEAISFAELQTKKESGDVLCCLLPTENAILSWPVLTLTEDLVYYLKQGKPVHTPNSPSKGRVRLRNAQNVFFGIGEMLEDGRVAPRRMLH